MTAAWQSCALQMRINTNSVIASMLKELMKSDRSSPSNTIKKKMHPYPCGKSDTFSANAMIFEKAYFVTLTSVYESLNFDFGKRRNMP